MTGINKIIEDSFGVGDGNIFTRIFTSISKIFSVLDPTSDNFIFRLFFKWFDPNDPAFIFNNLFSWLNPSHENFIGNQFVKLFKDMLELLFKPKQESFTQITNTFSDKFTFVGSLNSAINTIQGYVNGAIEAPKMVLSFEPTKYTNNMEIAVIDMSWYSKFKPYGDLVITGFVYIAFAWRKYITISSIINGASGGVQDGIIIYNSKKGKGE